MKLWLVRIFRLFSIPVDLLFAVLAVPSGLALLAYRRIGSSRLKITTGVLKKIGVFPIRKHYYEPMFDISQLERPLTQDRELPGIDLNDAGQMKFLGELLFSEELLAMKLDEQPTTLQGFWIGNPSFQSGDAEFLYQFVRAVKPGKLIEIGGGNSTRLSRLAMEKNRQAGAQATQVCIEPYEESWLKELGGIEVIRKRLEDCEIDWSKALGPGDLLFIDSSHMIRPQGDVLMEYLEILPKLASGVYIHIHDVFTPKDYLQSWMADDIRFWNEQYLMEALLSGSDRYEIVGALNYLKHHHYDELKRVCPYISPEREPGSMYLRVR